MSNSAKKGPSERKIIVYAYAKLANLSPDIRCTICSNFLTKTHSVPECLHRICGECVEDKEASLMQYKSECPSCRYHIPNKQFLRRDETFDKMVYTIRSVSGLLEDTVRRSVAERADAKRTMNSIDEAIDSVGKNCDEKRRKQHSDEEKRRKLYSDDEKRRKLHLDALRATMLEQSLNANTDGRKQPVQDTHRTYPSTIHTQSSNANTDGRNQPVQDAHRTYPSTIHTQSSNANTDARIQAVHDAKKQMTWDNVFDGVLPPGV